MPYEFKWHRPNEVLCLQMHNTLSLDELQLINQYMLDVLNRTDKSLKLLIDASNLKTTYSTVDNLRDTQRYRDHHNLDTLAVVSTNRLNRLVTLLAFSLSRAHFVQFENNEKAHSYIA